MPKVSVVIPSYNHEEFVGQAIQSVLDQTWQDFELIIVDDGSRDGSVEQIKKFDDPRIRLFVFEKNQGVCMAMNKGVNEAQGQYIAILNSDDMFMRDKLEKQVKYLDNNDDIGAVFGYAEIINEDGSEFRNTEHYYYNIFNQPNRSSCEWLNYFFYKGNCLCHPSIMIRKDCYRNIGAYDERFAQIPDLDFWIRLCMRYKIYVMPEKLIRFRIRRYEENASGNRPEAKIRGAWELSRTLENYLNIKDGHEFYSIFPEEKTAEYKLEKTDIHYLVSMLANKVDRSTHKSFAINTLFGLLEDSSSAERLRQRYGFTYADFMKLTGEADIFNTIGSWISKLFVDTGSGYSEELSKQQRIDINTSFFTLSFDIPGIAEEIKALRWDPVEGRFCNVNIMSLTCQYDEGELTSIDPHTLFSNGKREADGLVRFETFDPAFVFAVSGKPRRVIISGYWEFMDNYQIEVNHINPMRQSIGSLRNELETRERELETRERELKARDKELEAMRSRLKVMEAGFIEKDNAIEGHLLELDGKAKLIEEIKKDRSTLKNLLTASNHKIDELKNTIESSSAEIKVQEKELENKQKIIEKQKQEISYLKEQVIAAMEAEIQAKSAVIQAQIEELGRNEKVMEEQRQEIEELRNKVIPELRAELEASQRLIQQQQATMDYYMSEICRRDAILEGIYSSRSWKLISRYKTVKGRFSQRKQKISHNMAALKKRFRNAGEVSKLPAWSGNEWRLRFSVSKWFEQVFRILGGLMPVNKATLYNVKIKNSINPERPKIIHAIPNVFVGGSTQLIIDLVEHYGHKYDMEIITYALPKEGKHKGLSIHDFSHIQSPEEVAEFLRQKKADILHVHYWGEGDTPWYAKIFDAANSYPCKVVENINTPIHAYMHQEVDHYVYVSEYAQKMFGEYPPNSSVVHPGIDFTHFMPVAREKKPYAVGMVYRLEPDKLNEQAIEVFIELAKRRPQVLVYIVGFGTYFQPYVDRVYQEGVRQNFVFTGYVPYKKLPQVYDKFSIFVAPVWKESFGQVSPFAMNKEMVVTGYNVGALPEILNGTETLGSDLNELVEKITYYLDNEEAYAAKAREYRQRAQQMFSVEAMVDKYDKLYSQLLKK